MYYPEGMKARVSPVQSIEPHRILAPTRDLNREPLGPQSRVVTTILPLHTIDSQFTIFSDTCFANCLYFIFQCMLFYKLYILLGTLLWIFNRGIL